MSELDASGGRGGNPNGLKAALLASLLLALGLGGGWLVFGWFRPPPVITEVHYNPSSSIAPESLKGAAATQLQNIIDAESEKLDLAASQVQAIRVQASQIITANVAGSFEEYMALVFSWGGRPIERISDADLSALRERWARRQWLSVDPTGLRLRVADRDSDGYIVLPTNHGEAFGNRGVTVESIFEYGVDIQDEFHNGAPIIDIGFPATIRNKNGDSELIAVHFSLIWSSRVNRWTPFTSRAFSSNPIEGFTN